MQDEFEIVKKLSKEHSKWKLLRILEVSKISYYYNQKEKKNQRANVEEIGKIENKLKRDFSIEKLNEKWLSDITYIHSEREGWCYLSSIMDLKSNRIISHKE